MRDPELITGEVGTEMGDEDGIIRGLCCDGDNMICGDGVSRLTGDSIGLCRLSLT